MGSLESISVITENNLNRQIEEYKRILEKAQNIIGILSIFLPLYIYFLEKSNLVIVIISIIPIVLIIIGIVLMLSIMRNKSPLTFGINEDRLQVLSEKGDEEILSYNIFANIYSISQSKILIDRINKRFNKGLVLVIISIILSVVLLVLSIFTYSK
ncbi:MAG: hypothetical protein ABSF32_08795 [Ignavibacteria bacterium]